MKRRKRKRRSKAANTPTPKISSDLENSASNSTALAGADYMIDLGDELAVAVETETPLEPSVVRDVADRQTPPRDELVAAVETGKPAEPSLAPAGADRRTHPRYEFTAAVEVIAAESGARIDTHVRDLSQQGCYVDTNKPLPLGTVTDVRVTKGTQLLEARGRVVYSRVGKGMGLVFTAN